MKIKTLKQLIKASLEKKSVVLRYLTRPLPAAFVVNMQAIRVHHMIEHGMWIYRRKSK